MKERLSHTFEQDRANSYKLFADVSNAGTTSDFTEARGPHEAALASRLTTAVRNTSRLDGRCKANVENVSSTTDYLVLYSYAPSVE